MTPRATIDPLLLVDDDSATALLLISRSHFTTQMTFSSVELISRLPGIVTYLPDRRTPRRSALGHPPLDAHRSIPYDPADLIRQSERIKVCAEESARGGNDPEGVRAEAQARRAGRLHLLA